MWSNPDAKWDGFQPVQYLLDRTKVLSLPFTRVKTSGSKWIEAGDMTLGSVLLEGANRHIRTMEQLIKNSIATPDDAEDIVVASVAFNCRLLETLLSFRSRDIDAFNATWFWYDSATCLDTPLDSYSFFVVHNKTIVNEQVKFSDSHSYGFDPTVLTAGDTSEIWSNDKGWDDAVTRFWYRKFYRETMTGQLMVLRSDEPDLFHYPEGALVRRLFPQSADPEFLAKLQAALSALAGTE
jgi:hypothetical protein